MACFIESLIRAHEGLCVSPIIGFVVNDTLMLTVNITVQRDMHLDRLTRSQTGIVGLNDRGDNSYMNSLLRSLYPVRCFRRVRIELIDAMNAKKQTMNGLGGLSHADVEDG